MIKDKDKNGYGTTVQDLVFKILCHLMVGKQMANYVHVDPFSLKRNCLYIFVFIIK